jgi:hypothetical protein
MASLLRCGFAAAKGDSSSPDSPPPSFPTAHIGPTSAMFMNSLSKPHTPTHPFPHNPLLILLQAAVCGALKAASPAE